MKIPGSIVLMLLMLVALSNCSTSGLTAVPPTAVPPTAEPTAIRPTREMTPSPSGIATPSNMGVVVIQGIFDPAGEKLLKLQPIRRHSYNSPPIPNQPQGRFVVRVVDITGQATLVPFDALVADDAGRTQHGFFEVTVPVRGKIAYIEILDAGGEKTFARINASEILP